MVKYLLLRTLTKTIRQKIIEEHVVKAIGTCRIAYYSSNTEDKKSLPNKKCPSSSCQNQGQKLKKRRSWKLLPILGLVTVSCFGLSLCIVLGAPGTNIDGKFIKDDLIDEPVARQYLIRTYREMKYYFKLLQKPQAEKLLPDPLDPPYNQPKYTLVIELTDVFVHPEWTYSSGWRYKKRPLLDHFLQALKDAYEIILYTGEQGKTVFSLMDAIDPNNIIAYKLVRDATTFTGFHHVKQLNKLNRDLKKVICIDWNPNRVKQNPENLLKIKRWTGKDDDTSLLDLAAFLKTITDSQIEDVREVLIYYSKYNDPVEAFRKKQEMLIEELEKAAARSGTLPKAQSGFKLFN